MPVLPVPGCSVGGCPCITEEPGLGRAAPDQGVKCGNCSISHPWLYGMSEASSHRNFVLVQLKSISKWQYFCTAVWCGYTPAAGQFKSLYRACMWAFLQLKFWVASACVSAFLAPGGMCGWRLPLGGGKVYGVLMCRAWHPHLARESSKTTPNVPYAYPTVGVQFVCTHCEMGMRYLALRTAAVWGLSSASESSPVGAWNRLRCWFLLQVYALLCIRCLLQIHFLVLFSKSAFWVLWPPNGKARTELLGCFSVNGAELGSAVQGPLPGFCRWM